MDDPLVCLVTQDPQLSALLGRLCDAAGVRWRSWPAGGGGDPVALARRHPGVALVLVCAESARTAYVGGSGGRGGSGGSGSAGGAGGAALVIVATDPVDEPVWRYAVQAGAEQVVVLPDAESWLVDRVLAVQGPGSGPGPLISVIGGRGGAGASVLAVSLALGAARRAAPVLLVDADPLGCGSDLLLAAHELPGLRWPELAETRGRVDGAAVLAGLPTADGVAVLTRGAGRGAGRGPGAGSSAAAAGVPEGEQAQAVIDALARHVNLTVVDLPRGAGPTWYVVLARSLLTLLVVPAEVTATAAAARVRDRVRDHARDLRVVVRGPARNGLPAELVADALELPLAGWLRPEPGLAAALDRGEPPMLRGRGPLNRFTTALLEQVMAR